jgi:uncharacterized protein YbjT (DUF2867 family)
MAHLVTGATGNVGGLVVERLLERGERPRVFVRDGAKARARFGERVDVFVGDLADPGSLRPALRGVDAVFLVNVGPGLAALDEAAAAVARAEGTPRLVKLSSMDVEENVGTGVWHARGEAAIRASGITFTFVRPGGFMDNALHWARSIQSDGVVRSATGDGKIAFIHSDDIADVAVAVLTSRRFDGEAVALTGPQALSYAEMTAEIGRAIGRAIRYEAISEDAARARQLAAGDGGAMLAAHLDIFRAIREGRLARVTGEVRRVLGRSPQTFADWCSSHAGAFRLAA